MNIIKSMFASFTRLWRWIRETAWVQPLLIVGGIFAIIFSIPKFTTWFGAMASDSNSGYFTSFRLSLEGELRPETIDGKTTTYTTEADKLTRTLANWSSPFIVEAEYDDYEEFHTAMANAGALAYGDKYFLGYVARDNSGTESAREGFETLQDQWGTSFIPATSGEKFNMHTIFTDDSSTNDDDFEVDNDKKAFSRYLNKWNGGDGGADYFSYIGTELEDRPYKANASVSDSDYDAITTPDIDTWKTPTFMLVDFTKEAYESGTYGVCEVMFTISGDNAYDKAANIMQMWNHLDGRTDNPFSSNYQKA